MKDFDMVSCIYLVIFVSYFVKTLNWDCQSMQPADHLNLNEQVDTKVLLSRKLLSNTFAFNTLE